MSKITYKISAPKPSSHYFCVEIEVQRPNSKGQNFRLPTWIPGSYLIREFAQHVQKVTATCDGKLIAIDKTSKDTWQAEACDYAFDVSVRGSYLDNTRAFFNGTSVFLEVVGQENEPVDLHIQKIEDDCAEDWEVACTYPIIKVDKQGYGHYRAENYEQLIDHPVEIAQLTDENFDVNGIPHKMIFSGQHRGDLPRLAKDLEKICAEHVKMFGELPVEQYLFQTLVTPDSYGGLEHRDSTALVCGQHDLPQQKDSEKITDDYRKYLGLCSHEYFHLWNVKRIRPKAYRTTNWGEEAYTRQLWIFEGMTSYYDDLALVRSGVIDKKSYLELLSTTFNRVNNTKGRLNQSLADSSFDTWIKFYRPNSNTPNSGVSYYAKGSLAALALDLTIRQGTHNLKSLDDVMRKAWHESGKTERGLEEGEFEQFCSEVAGVDLSDFFNDWIYSAKDVDIEPLLSDFGVELSAKSQVKCSRVTDLMGIEVEMRGPLLFAKCVHKDSVAEQAGVAAGDELVSLNGVKLKRASLSNLAKQYAAGDKVKLLTFRRDALMKFKFKLNDSHKKLWKAGLDKEASDVAMLNQDSWLSSS